MQSFIIPAGLSPEEVAKKKAISDRLMMQGLQAQPQTIGDGLGAIADMLLGRGYYEASKKDSERMQEVGRQALGAWGMGGQPEVQATPPQQGMPSASVEPVQITNLPPPGYGDSVTVGGDGMGDIVPPAQMPPQQQMAQAQPVAQVDSTAARRAFRQLSDDQLLQNLMNPDIVKATEWLNPMIPKIAQEELARRWDYLSEQQKQEFQLRMQGRGFEQEKRMLGLRTRADLEKTAIEQGYGSVEEMLAGGGTAQAQSTRAKTAAEAQEREQNVIKQQREKEEEVFVATQTINEIDNALQFLNEKGEGAKFNPFDWGAAGPGASARADLPIIGPYTDAGQFRAMLKGVAEKTGFKALLNAKANSPTGASGFGALNEKELELLKNAYATLEQDLPPEILYKNLVVVRDLMRKALSGNVPDAPDYGSQSQQGGGLSPEKMQRLEELRRKRDQGLIQ